MGASGGLNLGLFTYPFAESLWGPTALKLVVLFDLCINQWYPLPTTHLHTRGIGPCWCLRLLLLTAVCRRRPLSNPLSATPPPRSILIVSPMLFWWFASRRSEITVRQSCYLATCYSCARAAQHLCCCCCSCVRQCARRQARSRGRAQPAALGAQPPHNPPVTPLSALRSPPSQAGSAGAAAPASAPLSALGSHLRSPCLAALFAALLLQLLRVPLPPAAASVLEVLGQANKPLALLSLGMLLDLRGLGRAAPDIAALLVRRSLQRPRISPAEPPWVERARPGADSGTRLTPVVLFCYFCGFLFSYLSISYPLRRVSATACRCSRALRCCGPSGARARVARRRWTAPRSRQSSWRECPTGKRGALGRKSGCCWDGKK